MKFSQALEELENFLSFEYAGVEPDIVPIAKGLGGGFPIGAVLMNKKMAKYNESRHTWFHFWRKPTSNECWKCSIRSNIQKRIFEKVKKISKYFQSGTKKNTFGISKYYQRC